jgi:hypothetical protein
MNWIELRKEHSWRNGGIIQVFRRLIISEVINSEWEGARSLIRQGRKRGKGYYVRGLQSVLQLEMQRKHDISDLFTYTRGVTEPYCKQYLWFS